jgi:glycosyltransferase involved in cell wall biosynthesis
MANQKKIPAVSVIVPVYKVEKYIRRSMDSLVNRTLENIEIICINDGSPDNCLSILKEYQAKYPEKIVIINKQNE